MIQCCCINAWIGRSTYQEKAQGHFVQKYHCGFHYSTDSPFVTISHSTTPKDHLNTRHIHSDICLSAPDLIMFIVHICLSVSVCLSCMSKCIHITSFRVDFMDHGLWCSPFHRYNSLKKHLLRIQTSFVSCLLTDEAFL